ncbi:MAG: hypothetical protein K9I99_16810, partial [Melioribacteraceae bacterium]|nr:hypothetical protein [Melioribacteraceae bacterium]
VEKRNYFEQDFDIKLNEFLTEREDSIQWLKSLKNPDLAQFYNHPKFGKMSGKLFLSNWLAHDYLHIRQITGVKFFYLKHISGETLDYAGNW